MLIRKITEITKQSKIKINKIKCVKSSMYICSLLDYMSIVPPGAQLVPRRVQSIKRLIGVLVVEDVLDGLSKGSATAC